MSCIIIAEKQDAKKEVVPQPIPTPQKPNPIAQLANIINNVSNRLSNIEIKFLKLDAADEIIEKRLNFYKELLDELKSKIELKD